MMDEDGQECDTDKRIELGDGAEDTQQIGEESLT